MPSKKSFPQLAKLIVGHYTTYAKALGIPMPKLQKAALIMAEVGKEKYLANPKYQAKFSLDAYVTWWMRRRVHQALMDRAIVLARANPEKLERIILDLLETE